MQQRDLHLRPVPTSRPTSRPTFTNEAPRWRVAIERLAQMVRLYANWPSALMNRVGLLRSGALHEYRVRVAPGVTLPVLARGNGFDIRAVNEIFIGRVYDRWYQGATPADHVIDVGGNCGYFSILAACVMRPAHLVCVEPDPHNRAVLRANLTRNAVEAEVVAGAIVPESVREESIVLHRSSDPRLHTVLTRGAISAAGLTDRGADAGSIDVVALHLSDLVDAIPTGRRVSFLKVDIEGPEWDVLASLPDETWSRIECAVVESDAPMPAFDQCRLTELGFDVRSDGPFWAIRRT